MTFYFYSIYSLLLVLPNVISHNFLKGHRILAYLCLQVALTRMPLASSNSVSGQGLVQLSVPNKGVHKFMISLIYQTTITVFNLNR